MVSRGAVRLLSTSLAIACGAGPSLGAPIAAQGPAPPYVTIDQLLRTEGIGRAIRDAAGSVIVYERRIPYADRRDFGVDSAFTDLTASSLMVIEGEAPARPLLQASGTIQYMLGRFSPDGRRFSFFEIDGDRIALAVFDLARRSVRRFPLPPDIRTVDGSPPFWIDDARIVYAALPPGESPWRISGRHRANSRTDAARRRSWAGQSPSYSILRNRPGDGATALTGSLAIADVRTGEARALVQGRFLSLNISPDGRHAIAGRQWHGPLDEWSGLAGDVGLRSEPVVVDLRTGNALEGLARLSMVPGSTIWSPDGARVAFYGWEGDEDPHSGRYYLYDAGRQHLQALDMAGFEPAWGRLSEPPAAAWLGTGILIAAKSAVQASGAQGIDWILLQEAAPPRRLVAGMADADRNPVAATADRAYLLAAGDLWAVDRDGRLLNISGGRFGTLSRLTDAGGWLRWRTPIGSAPLMLSGRNRGAETFLAFDPRTAEIVPVAAMRAGTGFLIEGLPGKRSALWTVETEGRTALRLSRPSGQRLIATLNEQFDGVLRPRRTSITYTMAGGGTALTSCLHLPAETLPGRIPVVLEVYPASQPRCDRDSPLASRNVNAMSMPADLFVSNGMALLQVALPGDRLGTSEAPFAHVADLTRAALRAAADQAPVDSRRVAVIGGSQGGFLALWLATQMPELRAVVAKNGWSDPARHYFDRYALSRTDPEELPLLGSRRYEGDSYWSLGGPPWAQAERYARASPLLHADGLRAPLLMFNSDLDWFDIGQFEAMMVAMNRLGRQACLVTYWGEGHGASSPANIRHAWRLTLSWLAETLGVGRTAPAEC